jgi:hypothetical protein
MQANLDECWCVEVTSDRHLPTYKRGDAVILLPGVKVETMDHVADFACRYQHSRLALFAR